LRGARLTALTLAALIFILDQASKLYVLYILELEFRGPLTINPYIDLILVWNRGISYGLFQQHADWGRYGLVLLSVGAAIGLTIWLFRTPVNWRSIGKCARQNSLRRGRRFRSPALARMAMVRF
jgi:signal peptidase II